MRHLAVALASAALFMAPTASAMPPGPFCPGTGTDVTILGAGGGYCDFMFLPDGSFVHCEWGGFDPGLIDVASVSNCWRVRADGTRIDPAPLDRGV